MLLVVTLALNIVVLLMLLGVKGFQIGAALLRVMPSAGLFPLIGASVGSALLLVVFFGSSGRRLVPVTSLCVAVILAYALVGMVGRNDRCVDLAPPADLDLVVHDSDGVGWPTGQVHCRWKSTFDETVQETTSYGVLRVLRE